MIMIMIIMIIIMIVYYQMEDILATFDGAFKEQETANSNWLPVRDMKVSSSCG